MFLLVSRSVLSGCSGLQTFPHIARGGDTITLALGDADGMRKDNIAITFRPDSGGADIDLTPYMRSFFKVYPDPTSAAMMDASGFGGTLNGGRGVWQNAAVVDLPLSQTEGGPLPIGTGTITVHCNPSSACVYTNQFVPRIENMSIAIEIIPGLGEPNPGLHQGAFGIVNTGDVSKLEPLPQVVVRPVRNGSSNGNRYGAVELKIDVPATDHAGDPLQEIDYVFFSEDFSALSWQEHLFFRKDGDVLTVSIVSPEGIPYTAVRFSIVLRYVPGSTVSHPIFTGNPTLISANYYDLDGNLVTTPPSVTVSLDYNN